jgi:nicotinamidase-related amidase
LHYLITYAHFCRYTDTFKNIKPMGNKTENTALLIMDMQSAIVAMLPDALSPLSSAVKAIAYARANNIPVIYVVVGFRQGTPEISVNNKGFAASKDRFLNADMNEFVKIHRAVAPQEGDIIVTKRRVSAFTGSDLEVVLRAKGIQHLVLTGFATSGVVLSTVREAADKDYRLTILSDACADGDEEIHHVLTTKVFPRQADVMTVDEWLKQ